jgi:DNA mismatch repair protein MutS2
MRTPLTDELDLHRLTVDEALLVLDQYLHDAYLAGYSQVRIVHGKGTGILRQMVRRELSVHPLVSSFRPGERYEGGLGVTVAVFSGK